MKNNYLSVLFSFLILVSITVQAQESMIQEGIEYVTSPEKHKSNYEEGSSRDAGYQVDLGTISSQASSGTNNDMMWMNRFTVILGAEYITTISLTFGMAGGGPSNPPLGTPIRIILYDDPDDDGNPVNATYLTESATTITHYGFPIIDVPITPTMVSGQFYVAALFQNHTNTYPISVDLTAPTNASFTHRESVPGNFDVFNLSANSGPILQNSSWSWVLRAYGVSSPPPPPSVPLSVHGIIAAVVLIGIVTFFRRRKAKVA